MSNCNSGSINDFNAFLYTFAQSGFAGQDYAGAIMLYFFTNTCVTPSVPFAYVEYFELVTVPINENAISNQNFVPLNTTLLCSGTKTISTIKQSGGDAGGLPNPLTVQWDGSTLSESAFTVTYGSSVVTGTNVLTSGFPNGFTFRGFIQNSVCCGLQGLYSSPIVYTDSCDGGNSTPSKNGGGTTPPTTDFFQKYETEIIIGVVLFVLFLIVLLVFSRKKAKPTT